MKYKYPKVSSRFKILLEPAIVGSPVWDVCCDHGILGIEALRSSLYGRIYFVDQVASITKLLQEKLNYYVGFGLSSDFEIITHNAEKIEVDVEGTFIVAGVGGKTIKDIVTSLIENNRMHASRLILSAHTDEALMVSYLDSNIFNQKYKIVDKKEYRDRLKIRSIYILDRR